MTKHLNCGQVMTLLFKLLLRPAYFLLALMRQMFDDVIVYGEPPNTDELLQDYGQLQYLKSVSPQAFLYITKVAHTKAAQLLGEVNKLPMLHNACSTADTDMLQLSCKVAQLDELYGNILNELPCSCLGCQAHPHPQ